ncbi:MAG: Wzy polymerase domain-containing protein [Rhodoferax sp.]|nr:Wzy polymerase domain-containing protein [Rhodoferax sp.]
MTTCSEHSTPNQPDGQHPAWPSLASLLICPVPAIAFILLCLPWLNPFSPGPMAQAMPLLFAWSCAAGVLLTFAADRQRGQSPTMVRALVLAWATAAGLSAAIGLLQYFGATARFGVWINHTEVGAAFGNLRQRNQFATLLNIGLAAALWLAVQARRSAAGAVALAALVSVGNAASGSRTGLFQLLLILLMTLGWLRAGVTQQQKQRVQTALLAALGAYALALMVLPLLAGLSPLATGALARLHTGDSACASRLTLWGNVLHLIGQRPWLGWGWGELDYAHFITLYPGTRFCDILDNAHNLPLHLAVELGAPAALLLCAAALWLVWRGQPWRERDPTRQLAWALLAVILLHSLLEYPLWYGPFQAAALLSGWLLCWLPQPLDSLQNKQCLLPSARIAYALPAILVIVYCGFAGWNYHVVSQIYLDPGQRAAAYQVNTSQKIRQVWLYQDPARFAELTTADLNADNATDLNALAKEMLHFSPETRVVRLLLDSARLLGRDDEVAFYAARFRAAFPDEYAAWAAEKH